MIDESLQKLKDYCLNKWPNDKKLCHELVKPYFHVRDEIHSLNEIVFKGECLLIPKSMRKEIIEKVHKGHLGVNKCLSLLKEVAFWPNMTSDVKNKIENCEICLRNSNNNRKQPLMNHEPVTLPFEKVGIDLAEFDGKKLLVVVDYYSKFVEIAFLNSTTANVIVKHLKCIFARYGIPLVVISDNGPPFSSIEFKTFAKYNL